MRSIFDSKSKNSNPQKKKLSAFDFLAQFSKEFNTYTNQLHLSLLPQELRDEILQDFIDFYSCEYALVEQLSEDKRKELKTFFIQHLQTQIQCYSNTHYFPKPRSPMSRKQSGVEIDCFLFDGRNYIDGVFDAPVHGKIGMREKAKTKKSSSSRNAHAEDIWFQDNQEKLGCFLQSNKFKLAREKLAENNDLFHHPAPQGSWLFHVNQGPRIEFLVSSSPCKDCQLHFINLRQFLNHLGIFIPIHIFSINTFNTYETDRSQFAIVDAQGNFISTNLFLNTQYDAINRGFFSLSYAQLTTLVNNRDLYAIHKELLEQSPKQKQIFLNQILRQLNREQKFEDLVFFDILLKGLKNILAIEETTFQQIKDLLKLHPTKRLPPSNVSLDLSQDLIRCLRMPGTRPEIVELAKPEEIPSTRYSAPHKLN